jgi:hypothetical protein
VSAALKYGCRRLERTEVMGEELGVRGQELGMKISAELGFWFHCFQVI